MPARADALTRLVDSMLAAEMGEYEASSMPVSETLSAGREPTARASLRSFWMSTWPPGAEGSRPVVPCCLRLPVQGREGEGAGYGGGRGFRSRVAVEERRLTSGEWETQFGGRMGWGLVTTSGWNPTIQ